MRKRSPHVFLTPIYFSNWIGEWVAYFLSQWSLFEVLEFVGSFSILIAVIFYFAGAGDRLKQKHYQGFARHQLPHPHEFFAPMEALTAFDGDKNPELHALLAHASATANFLSPP